MMAEAIIGIVVGILGAAFGLASFLRNRRKDDSEGGRFTATVMTELQHIKQTVDKIESKQSIYDDRHAQTMVRLTAIETTQNHIMERLDKLEKKKQTASKKTPA